MTATALNSLWEYIRSQALSPQDRRWLAGKLLDMADVKPEPYTMEELNARIDSFEEAIEAGETGTSHKNVMQRVRMKYALEHENQLV